MPWSFGRTMPVTVFADGGEQPGVAEAGGDVAHTPGGAALIPHLPEELISGGAKGGWWMKTVQLDQEARGTILRDPSKPTFWRRA